MMKIEDNFLDQEKFDELQTIMMGSNIDWHYSDGIDFPQYPTYSNQSDQKIAFLEYGVADGIIEK